MSSDEEVHYDLDSVSNDSQDTENDTIVVETQPSQSMHPHRPAPKISTIGKFKPARNMTGKKARAANKERSKVWEHYTKFDHPIMEVVDGEEKQIGIEKRAQCKYCPTSLKCDSRANGTSSLFKHIELSCKGYPGRIDLEHQKTLTADILDSNNGMVTRLWSEEACLEAAIVMIVLDELPFSVIERPGFIHFCKVAIPKWIPPCRKVVVKNFLRMYNAKKIELKDQLRSHCVSLTTDTWTSCQNINYMVITAHFIDDSWNMHKMVLKFCVIPNHSGVSIGKLLEGCVNEWGLQRVLTVTVDNASANKVAIEYLTEKLRVRMKPPMFGGIYMHVRCLAHILNLVVRSGLSMMNRSVASIRNAVRYVRSSPQRLEAFKECVEAERIGCKKICVLDVPTRWNSTYLMLDTALQLRKAFDRMADEEDARYTCYFEEDDELNEEEDESDSVLQQKKRIGPPNAVDWEKASVFVKYLKVFLQATIDVSAQLKPTSHKAFMNIATIKAEVDDIFDKPDVTEIDKVLLEMAKKMKMKFRKYFGSVGEVHMFYYVALILDPRYKLKGVEHVCHSMLLMNREDIIKKNDEVRKFMYDMCDIDSEEAAEDSSQSHVVKRKRGVTEGSTSSPSCLNMQPVQSGGKMAAMLDSWNKRLEGETSIVGNEVDRYLLDPIEKPKNNDNWNILDWWRFNGEKYPNLQILARDILAIQVSSVASESSFSTGKRVIDPHRSSLSPKTVEALICLQSWLKYDAIMGLDCIPSIEEQTWFEELEKEQAEEEAEKLKQENFQKSIEEETTTKQNQKTAKATKITKHSDASKTAKLSDLSKLSKAKSGVKFGKKK